MSPLLPPAVPPVCSNRYVQGGACYRVNKPNGNPGMLPNIPNIPPPGGGGAVLVLLVLECAAVLLVDVVEADELVEVLAELVEVLVAGVG